MKRIHAAGRGFGIAFLVTVACFCICALPLGFVTSGSTLAFALIFSGFISYAPAVLIVLLILSFIISTRFLKTEAEITGCIMFFFIFLLIAAGNQVIISHNKLISFVPGPFDHPMGTIPFLLLDDAITNHNAIWLLKGGQAEQIGEAAESKNRWYANDSASLKSWAECRSNLKGIELAQQAGLFEDCVSINFSISNAPKGSVSVIRKSRYGVSNYAIAAFINDARGQPSKEIIRWEADYGKASFNTDQMVSALTEKSLFSSPFKASLDTRIEQIQHTIQSKVIIVSDNVFRLLFDAEYGSVNQPRMIAQHLSEIDQVAHQICESDLFVSDIYAHRSGDSSNTPKQSCFEAYGKFRDEIINRQ